MASLNIDTPVCPYCENAIYRNLALEASMDTLERPTRGPRVDNDEEGYFVKCPHCLKRVAMDWVSVLPIGGFDVSQIQPFGHARIPSVSIFIPDEPTALNRQPTDTEPDRRKNVTAEQWRPNSGTRSPQRLSFVVKEEQP